MKGWTVERECRVSNATGSRRRGDTYIVDRRLGSRHFGTRRLGTRRFGNRRSAHPSHHLSKPSHALTEQVQFLIHQG